MSDYVLFGKPGWGSAIVEAMLELSKVPYRVEPVDPLDPSPARDRMAKLNPLVQVPTLLLPDGTVMTESAAIGLYLADKVPGLAPPAGSPDRAAFLRWLVYLVAAIYPTFTYGDWPERYVSDPAAAKAFRQKTDHVREDNWRQVEGAAAASPWFLKSGFSVLDIYIRMMTTWRPKRAWFQENCPKLHAIAVACDNDARLVKVWGRNKLG
jgi:GST-like protein